MCTGSSPSIRPATSHNTLHSLHTTHYTLHTTHYTLHTTLNTIRTTHCIPHTTHYTLHTAHGAGAGGCRRVLGRRHQPGLPLHTIHYTLHPLHTARYILHTTHHTPHTSHYTLPSTRSVSNHRQCEDPCHSGDASYCERRGLESLASQLVS